MTDLKRKITIIIETEGVDDKPHTFTASGPMPQLLDNPGAEDVLQVLRGVLVAAGYTPAIVQDMTARDLNQ